MVKYTRAADLSSSPEKPHALIVEFPQGMKSYFPETARSGSVREKPKSPAWAGLQMFYRITKIGCDC